MRDHCQKTASVLTYYSLLNIVPVVAVAFAVAKGFGLEKLIEKKSSKLQKMQTGNRMSPIKLLHFLTNFLNRQREA